MCVEGRGGRLLWSRYFVSGGRGWGGGRERERLRSSRSRLRSSPVSVRPDELRAREKHKLVEEDAEDADGEVRRDVACRQSPVAGGGEVEESEQAQNGKATLSD